MRIIAGEHRGRRLAAPKGRGTRPMLDRVREALFSTLGARLEDAWVLDLFAGTGSLGLEALSRGAERVRLVERHAATLTLLRENVAALGGEERCEAAGGDALAPTSWRFSGSERLPDLALWDPPYPLLEGGDTRRRVLEAVDQQLRTGLAPDGLLVLHAPPGALSEGSFEAGVSARLRAYGRTALWYLELVP